jgi:signal transduction histidine kinase
MGYLEILRDREAGELTEDQEHFLEIVDRNCRRLNALIDDILLTARVDSGRFSLERRQVDLGMLAAEQAESIRAAAELKGVDVHLVVKEDPPLLWADPMRLAQLLDNLLSNALKFTPESGRVTVVVSRQDETACLEVADTGVGIAEDELDKVFQRFYRASTAQNVAGTGLGLPIAKSIAEAHGGTISVRSVLGAGTTFLVELPLKAEAEASRTQASSTEVNA